MAEDDERLDALRTWLWNNPAIMAWLGLVGVDFDAGDAWRQWLSAAGIDKHEPAAVSSTGISMYLT
jgi:O-methyltransferase involved in polyketide biosynthesis